MKGRKGASDGLVAGASAKEIDSLAARENGNTTAENEMGLDEDGAGTDEESTRAMDAAIQDAGNHL